MKKLMILLVLMLSLTLVVGCSIGKEEVSQNQEAAKITKLSPSEAKAIIDSDEEIVLLDVRTEEEHKEKFIEGSILIPVDDIESLAEDRLTDKDAKILIYCRSGNRSNIAAELLVGMGYTNIYDFGGIKDWPYETISQ